MTSKPDDLEAIRTLISILEPFNVEEQERIIRYAKEKLGLPAEAVAAVHRYPPSPERFVATVPESSAPEPRYQSRDIKAFVAEKNPQSDNHLAATVAFFYRFEAPEAQRKDVITAEDLLEACRMTGRTRLKNPGQTLRNAHGVGLLDKTEDRGVFAINTVGENLVAMTLPSLSGKSKVGQRKVAKKPIKKKASRKTKDTSKNKS